MKYSGTYNILLIVFLTTISTQLISQNNSAHLKPIAPDCNKAINIPFENKGSYGPTIAPNGGGETEEIQTNKKNDKYYFEKEHNTGWYYFDIKYDGILFMTITPKNSKDDYDFILFKYTDSTFCDELIKKNIIPVRTNISRTGMGGSEITGLSNNEENLFYSAGKGRAFSKSVILLKTYGLLQK